MSKARANAGAGSAYKQSKDLEWPSALYCVNLVFLMVSVFICAFIPPPLLGPLEHERLHMHGAWHIEREVDMPLAGCCEPSSVVMGH